MCARDFRPSPPHLGAVVDLSPAPKELTIRFQAAHKTIYDFEISQNLHPIIDPQPDKISAHAKDAVRRGRKLSTKDYREALLCAKTPDRSWPLFLQIMTGF